MTIKLAHFGVGSDGASVTFKGTPDELTELISIVHDADGDPDQIFTGPLETTCSEPGFFSADYADLERHAHCMAKRPSAAETWAPCPVADESGASSGFSVFEDTTAADRSLAGYVIRDASDGTYVHEGRISGYDYEDTADRASRFPTADDAQNWGGNLPGGGFFEPGRWEILPYAEAKRLDAERCAG